MAKLEADDVIDGKNSSRCLSRGAVDASCQRAFLLRDAAHPEIFACSCVGRVKRSGIWLVSRAEELLLLSVPLRCPHSALRRLPFVKIGSRRSAMQQGSRPVDTLGAPQVGGRLPAFCARRRESGKESLLFVDEEDQRRRRVARPGGACGDVVFLRAFQSLTVPQSARRVGPILERVARCSSGSAWSLLCPVLVERVH